MKITKTKLLFIATLFLLALPLIFADYAGASVYNSDGAVHNADGSWGLPADLGNCWDGAYPAAATKDTSITNYPACIAATVPAALAETSKTTCTSNGYKWAYGCADGTAGCCTNNWKFDSYPTGNDACLRCHNGVSQRASDRSTYMNGGHKNMLRASDGKPWGMPGVDSTHPFLGDPVQAGLNSDGSFKELWSQEDYPRWEIDWITGLTKTGTGYCGTSLGVTGTGDLPDLAACAAAGITCETPIMGNGAAGYPLGYPTQALCEAAKKPSTGAPGYVWTPYEGQKVDWFYGGAGLEGGPGMAEPGTQFYWCGRCHSTGWTADSSFNTAKLPASQFTDITSSTTAVGGSAKLLNTNNVKISGSAYPYSSWDQWGIECSRCHAAKDGGHATWPTGSTTGGDINALCMGCHRQDNGAPKASYGLTGSANVDAETVFTNTANQADGFVHHPDGNEFLNSPHAKFTGTWGQIGCPPYAITGYTTVGYNNSSPSDPGAPTDCDSSMAAYGSKFAAAAAADLGVTDGGGCTTCHDVHKSVNENSSQSPTAGALTACTACHANSSDTVTPQINLSAIQHPSGAGTPLENAATDPSSACVICHQPDGMKHLWRINTDPSYSSFGNFVDNAGKSAPTAADGSYSGAVWVDLDHACGQCHGGGMTNTAVTTTGTITNSSNSLTVADSTGFEAGKEITIIGAGVGGSDFKTIIAKVVDATHLTLTYNTPACSGAGTCGTGVTNAAVTVPGNATANGAPYMSKAQLASYAAGMHNGVSTQTVTAPTPSISGGAIGVDANWNATATDTSTAGSSALQSVTIAWGDGVVTTQAAGTTSFSHTYMKSGSYTVMQTATDTDGGSASVTYAVTVANPQIMGHVYKSDGVTPVGGAYVWVTRTANGKTNTYLVGSKTDGSFSFSNIAPGSFSNLKATKSGYTFPAPTNTINTTGGDNVIDAVTP